VAVAQAIASSAKAIAALVRATDACSASATSLAPPPLANNHSSTLPPVPAVARAVQAQAILHP